MTFTCHGNITSWSAYLKRNTFTEVIFQVWRPISNCSYRLVGQHSFDSDSARVSSRFVNVSVVERELQPITVEPGDFVGFYICCNNRAGIQADNSIMVGIYTTSNLDQTQASTITSITQHCPTEQQGFPAISAMVTESFGKSTLIF